MSQRADAKALREGRHGGAGPAVRDAVEHLVGSGRACRWWGRPRHQPGCRRRRRTLRWAVAGRACGLVGDAPRCNSGLARWLRQGIPCEASSAAKPVRAPRDRPPGSDEAAPREPHPALRGDRARGSLVAATIERALSMTAIAPDALEVSRSPVRSRYSWRRAARRRRPDPSPRAPRRAHAGAPAGRHAVGVPAVRPPRRPLAARPCSNDESGGDARKRRAAGSTPTSSARRTTCSVAPRRSCRAFDDPGTTSRRRSDPFVTAQP